MLPSILVAATLAVPVKTPFGIRGQFMGLPPIRASGSGAGISPSLAVHVWGDPSHLGGSVSPRVLQLYEELFNSKGAKPLPPVKVVPLDPTAERIKAIENVILELKAGGGSAAVIEQLQRDLDELKMKK